MRYIPMSRYMIQKIFIDFPVYFILDTILERSSGNARKSADLISIIHPSNVMTHSAENAQMLWA